MLINNLPQVERHLLLPQIHKVPQVPMKHKTTSRRKISRKPSLKIINARATRRTIKRYSVLLFNRPHHHHHHHLHQRQQQQKVQGKKFLKLPHKVERPIRIKIRQTLVYQIYYPRNRKCDV